MTSSEKWIGGAKQSLKWILGGILICVAFSNELKKIGDLYPSDPVLFALTGGLFLVTLVQYRLHIRIIDTELRILDTVVGLDELFSKSKISYLHTDKVLFSLLMWLTIPGAERVWNVIRIENFITISLIFYAVILTAYLFMRKVISAAILSSKQGNLDVEDQTVIAQNYSGNSKLWVFGAILASFALALMMAKIGLDTERTGHDFYRYGAYGVCILLAIVPEAFVMWRQP